MTSVETGKSTCAFIDWSDGQDSLRWAANPTPHAALERVMPIARPLKIKAPINEAAAAARAP